MELELKHLAAYLPYKIEVVRNHSAKNIVNLTSNDLHFIQSNEDKLILRPLSDLHNDFIHNISFETYNKNPEKFSGKFVNYLEFIWQNTRISERIDYYELLEEFSDDILEIANYHVLQILLKYHFDVFGLIDAKLAVDINCL